MTTLYIDHYESPVGLIYLVASSRETLIHLDFEGNMDRVHRLTKKRFKKYELIEKEHIHIRKSLDKYFQKDLNALRDIETDLGGTDFQETVWQALQEIPNGCVMTYAELAEKIGKPKAVRAVATANAQNPISLIYPCHRVIGTNGTLRGYAGGLHRKDWLLRHEGVKPTWT